MNLLAYIISRSSATLLISELGLIIELPIHKQYKDKINLSFHVKWLIH